MSTEETSENNTQDENDDGTNACIFIHLYINAHNFLKQERGILLRARKDIRPTGNSRNF
jgi:hypothetical protein